MVSMVSSLYQEGLINLKIFAEIATKPAIYIITNQLHLEDIIKQLHTLHLGKHTCVLYSEDFPLAESVTWKWGIHLNQTFVFCKSF